MQQTLGQTNHIEALLKPGQNYLRYHQEEAKETAKKNCGDSKGNIGHPVGKLKEKILRHTLKL